MDETFKKIWANHRASKTRLRKKFAKCKLDEITRKPLQCITEFKLIRGYLQKLDNSEMICHILLNLPEEYQTIVEILEDKLDDGSDFITIVYHWIKIN